MKEFRKFLIEHSFLEKFCEIIMDSNNTGYSKFSPNETCRYRNMLTDMYIWTQVRDNDYVDSEKFLEKIHEEWYHKINSDNTKQNDPIDISFSGRLRLVKELMKSDKSELLGVIRRIR